MISALDCGEQVAEWLSNVFSYPGLRLIRMNPDQLRKPREFSASHYSATTSGIHIS